MARFVCPWKTEAEMLTAVAAVAKEQGWKVYPETSHWDLLLVATDAVDSPGIKPGDQVAIEGKLTCTFKALTQAMPYPHAQGPHYHVVVVPRATQEFRTVAQRLRVLVIEAARKRWTGGKRAWGPANIRLALRFLPTYYRHIYEQPLWVPEVEVWTDPGAASPRRISPWKLNAVKLCLYAEEKGFLTAADFKKFGLSMTVWRNRWLKDAGRQGRFKKYALILEDFPLDPPPHLKYPEIAEALRQHDEEYEAASTEEHKRRSKRLQR